MTIKKKTLLFILSSNYSGSHFLSLLLGSHSKAEHLGELKNMRKRQNFSICYLCEDRSNCRLFDNIDKVDTENIYETLFSRVDDSIEVLVDASKKPDWFANFLDEERYDIKAIHLIRDPRALARRWLMRFEEKGIGPRERIKQCRQYPLKTPMFVFGDLLTVCIYKWISQNREIRQFIDKSGFDSRLVTYRELALEPDRTLGGICSWSGLDYEPRQKNYWEFEHHGTQKTEYEWVRQQGGAQYFDQRWKDYLTQDQVNRIEGNRDLLKFMEPLGLSFCDEGLYASR